MHTMSLTYPLEYLNCNPPHDSFSNDIRARPFLHADANHYHRDTRDHVVIGFALSTNVFVCLLKCSQMQFHNKQASQTGFKCRSSNNSCFKPPFANPLCLIPIEPLLTSAMIICSISFEFYRP